MGSTVHALSSLQILELSYGNCEIIISSQNGNIVGDS